MAEFGSKKFYFFSGKVWKKETKEGLKQIEKVNKKERKR